MQPAWAASVVTVPSELAGGVLDPAPEPPAGISDLTCTPLLPSTRVTVLTFELSLTAAPGTAAATALAAPSAPFGYSITVLSTTSELAAGMVVLKPSFCRAAALACSRPLDLV